MAEEVTKTIENVDRLFARIVVNGEVHESQNYVPQDSTDSVIAPQIVEENNQSDTQEPIAQPTQDVGEDVYSVVLNDTKHDFVDPETVQNLSQEVVARQNVDNQLQQGINGLTGDVADLGNDIDSINDKIPNQASSTNQLADKNFVNSSIATNTANFLGTYTSMADIEAIQDPTNNDYVFLQTTDASGNNLFDRYKYNADQDEWLFEYELNNSSFTAEQWATINSGLTQSSVDEDIADAISALPIPTKETVSASKSATVLGDMIYFVDTASVTLTLVFGSTQQVRAEVYAIADCTVTYYTDANTAVSLSMVAGTCATFVYFNGWKFNGVYGAVWN